MDLFVFSKVIFLLFFEVFRSLAPLAEGAACTFNVTNKATERYQPIPLFNSSSDYQLAVPYQGTIRLAAGQNISLLCAGNRNYVRQTNANISTVTCIEGDVVKLFRNVYKFEEIQCKNAVRGEVRNTKTKCGTHAQEGVVFRIGYPPSRTDWLTLISICYIPENGNTLYTRHVIHGKEIKYASKTSYRPFFSTAGEMFNITSSVAYKQAYQKSTFSSILGSSVLASRYINRKYFLAKGHLSPDADFLLATEQYSTYYYINVAPQWQIINTANWKSVEFTMRNMATYYGYLEVITGTHGILTYNDSDNIPQPISLGTNGILPVPKYFWKIAYEPKTRRAIVFIVLNDPHTKDATPDVFCQDTCLEHGFLKNAWKNASSGYVFCCSVSDFKKEVKSSPELEVSAVLPDPCIDDDDEHVALYNKTLTKFSLNQAKFRCNPVAGKLIWLQHTNGRPILPFN
ncbi:uncharacterized protein [Euwallacea fornicatus]|uniref:uncharacterized protein n=1 Tax=Euwallacea fornicatus TaxID=995702 RepID=UPI00338D3914